MPGHRLPSASADVSAIRYTRDYLNAFEEILASSPDGAAVTDALVKRYPDSGMRIAASMCIYTNDRITLERVRRPGS